MKSKDNGGVPSVTDSKPGGGEINHGYSGNEAVTIATVSDSKPGGGEINHGYSGNEAVTVATVSDTVAQNYKF